VSDFDDLRRIIEPVVSVEHAGDGLLTLRFKDGTRLSFLCGHTGRLNGIVVQHGPTTPELRLPNRCPKCRGTGLQDCDDPQCNDSTWDHYCNAGMCDDCKGSGKPT
jgi:hypothetical protein